MDNNGFKVPRQLKPYELFDDEEDLIDSIGKFIGRNKLLPKLELPAADCKIILNLVSRLQTIIKDSGIDTIKRRAALPTKNVLDIRAYSANVHVLGKCPDCKAEVNSLQDTNYCGKCGCKLTWPNR